MGRPRTLMLRVLVHGAALLLLVGLAWAYWQGLLGPDPVGELTRRTGRYAIIFLLLSLVPTVAATLSFRDLLQIRRALGLYAFFFALLHLLAFAGVDYAFNLAQLARVIREDPRVLAGVATLLLLLPLAVTSTNTAVRRLGKNWKRLHRLAYLAAGLDVVHYALNFKELRFLPVLAGSVLVLLLLVRLPPVTRLLRRLGGERPSPS